MIEEKKLKTSLWRQTQRKTLSVPSQNADLTTNPLSNNMIENLSNKTIPQGWLVCNLPDFTYIEMGQSPPSNTYNFEGIGLPFFQGKAEFTALYPEIRKYCSKPNKIAKAGATLLTVRAPVGPTNLAAIDCCIGRGLAGIHPLGAIKSKFILLLMRSIEAKISDQGTGSTFTAINKKFLEELKFALPPLNEQKRIVAKIEELFSELDRGVESLKLAQTQLKTYRQSILKHAFEGKLTAKWREENCLAFNWETKTIKELTVINPKHKNVDDEHEISFVPMGALNQEKATIDDHEYRKFGEIKKGYTHFSENDILFAKITPCMENGKNGIARDLRNGLACGSTEFFVFRCNDELLPEYLLLKFRDTLFRRLAKANMTGAVGQRRVPKNWIEKVEINLPPISEQQKIIEEVSTLNEEIYQVEQDISDNLKRSETLRQSILKKAFSGQLVAQDSNDEPASELLKRIKSQKATKASTKQKKRAS